MKNFIQTTVLFLIPVIVFFLFLETLLRIIPNDYRYKKNYLTNNSNSIDKLFLGNSHVYYGVNPDFISGNSFNASHIGQTLEIDYKILKKYEANWDNLNHLIIPIDYFNFSLKMAESAESWRIKNYNIYYNINLSNNLVQNSELLSISLRTNIRRILSYYLLKKPIESCSKLGFGNTYRKSDDLIKTGETAALRHTNKDLTKWNNNLNILKQIIDFASKRKIQIIFYTSPAYKSYVSNLNKNQLNLMIKSITELSEKNKNCHYINLLSDPSFTSDDFRDGDHLNPNGAIKLSLLLENLINKKPKG